MSYLELECLKSIACLHVIVAHPSKARRNLTSITAAGMEDNLFFPTKFSHMEKINYFGISPHSEQTGLPPSRFYLIVYLSNIAQ